MENIENPRFSRKIERSQSTASRGPKSTRPCLVNFFLHYIGLNVTTFPVSQPLRTWRENHSSRSFSAEKSKEIYAEFRRGFEMEDIENPRFSRKIERSQSTAKPWSEEYS